MTGVGEIKAEIKRIVGLVSKRFKDEVLPKLSEDDAKYYKKVTFFWGNPLEVITVLKEYSTHKELKYEKFPFIALYNDISIVKNKYGDYDGTLLEIIIANATDPNLKSEQREIQNFKPILRPLYGFFIEELQKSSIFVVNDVQADIKHEVTERYFWGRQGLYGQKGNVYNDYIDAIHIARLDLKLNDHYC